MISLIKLIKDATKAVPAVKYAVGVLGLIAVVALIISIKIELRLALWGTIILFGLMILLVLFARLATSASDVFKIPIQVVLWFVVLMFISTTTLLSSSVFFQWPVNLAYVISTRDEQFNPSFSLKIEKSSLPSFDYPKVKFPVTANFYLPEKTVKGEIASDGTFTNVGINGLNKKVFFNIEDDYWVNAEDSIMLTRGMISLFLKPKDIFSKISGTIKSLDGYTKIGQASVFVDNDTVLKTDNDGVFKASLVHEMVRTHYKLSITAQGYEPKEISDYYPNSNPLEIRLIKK